MFAVLVSAFKTAAISMIGALLIRVIMFLGFNVAMQFLLSQFTDLSVNIFNPFNIGVLINGLLAQIVWPEVLWGMSFLPVTSILALGLNAMLASWAFRLMKDAL